MPHAGSPSPPAATDKPIVLHLGDPITYSFDFYHQLQTQFDFIRPSASDLKRSAFIAHLRKRTWGDFSAIMRPFWNTGGEMGRWDKEIIEVLPPTVRVYASAGAGYDWVDTHALADHGILYCNARGASTEAVADMGLYYIISVFRNMTMSHLSARSINPDTFNEAHLELPSTSCNPRGHTLGIIGLGDIGFAIARKVHVALGMKIMYNDIQQKSDTQESEVQATYYRDLEEMLSKSDCVLIATPFSGETLITAKLLVKFKPGSRLVNIARGSLIDETALADALDSGHLSGAALDVHANEPHVNERLAKNWKVALSCHTGGGALETWVNFERLAMENVERVLTGREALTGVNGHLIRRNEGNEGHVNGHTSEEATSDPRSSMTVNGGEATHVNGSIHHQASINGDMYRQTGIIGGV